MTRREPRPDLGIDFSVFGFKDREGVGCVKIQTRDIFGTPIAVTKADLSLYFYGLARDLASASDAEALEEDEDE